MKNRPRLRALAPIVIGLLGMGAYQIILRGQHPVMMESDLFHGLWLGICVGLEMTGVYMLGKRHRG